MAIKTQLVSTLAKVIAGGDVDYGDLERIIAPDAARATLSGAEAKAYWALWRWADDADIRQKDPDTRYADLQRQGLRDIKIELEAPES